MYYKYWPKKTVAKILEDAIINGGLNLMLDPGAQRKAGLVFVIIWSRSLLIAEIT